MACAVCSQSIKGRMKILLSNHPIYKQLANNLRKPKFQNIRFPNGKGIIFHTTDQLHEKPINSEVKNERSS
jgi:hypothetical protein